MKRRVVSLRGNLFPLRRPVTRFLVCLMLWQLVSQGFPLPNVTFEGIQFLLPSLARSGLEGGRESRWTNPLTKGDAPEVSPEPNFSQLDGGGSPAKTPQPRLKYLGLGNTGTLGRYNSAAACRGQTCPCSEWAR